MLSKVIAFLGPPRARFANCPANIGTRFRRSCSYQASARDILSSQTRKRPYLSLRAIGAADALSIREASRLSEVRSQVDAPRPTKHLSSPRNFSSRVSPLTSFCLAGALAQPSEKRQELETENEMKRTKPPLAHPSAPFRGTGRAF